MFRSRTSRGPYALILLVILALAGLTWFNYWYAKDNPGGNDFLPRWVGTRAFLTRGVSPYSETVSQEIQRMIFGRSAQPGEDESLFVYPLYSVLVFSPYAVFSDYVVARALWMTTLELALVGLTWVSLVLARWRLSPILLGVLVLFSILWYHGFRPVINGNASILSALFIGLAFLAIRQGYDPLAGILLPLASIKPQMTLLLVLFVLLWSASQARWGLFWSVVAGHLFLIAIFSLFIPDWVLQNLTQIIDYPEYTLPGTPGSIFAAWLPGVGNQLGWALTGIMVVLLLVEWRAVWGKEEFNWFYWTACLTLVITNLIGIRTATENFIALYPGLILVFANWDLRWKEGGRGMVLFSMTLLFFGLWALFLRTLEPGSQPTQNLVMFFPLPLFVLIGLYWVRWWAIRPPRVLLDEIKISRRGQK